MSDYRSIPGYDGYSVSSTGSIRGPRGEMRPMRNQGGYLYVLTAKRCKPRKLFVHKAILLAFVGPCPAGCESRHGNDIPDDNRLDNLCWGTRLENNADKRRNGRIPCGERSGGAKLTAEQVQQIRLERPYSTARALAEKFGVTHTTIIKACNGKRWRCIPGVVNGKN